MGRSQPVLLACMLLLPCCCLGLALRPALRPARRVAAVARAGPLPATAGRPQGRGLSPLAGLLLYVVRKGGNRASGVHFPLRPRRREGRGQLSPRAATTVIEHIEAYHDDQLKKDELVLDSQATVGECLANMRAQARRDAGGTASRLSELGVAWVVNPVGVLCGYVGATELLLCDPSTLLSEITKPLPLVVRADDSLESTVQLLQKEALAVAPVVDDRGVLITAFAPIEVMAALQAEATEDVAKLALSGGVGDAYFGARVLGVVANRLAWLLSLLMLQSLSSVVLASYSSLLADHLLLAVFLTTITGTSGNAGNQTSAVVIRGLATGDIDAARDTRRVLQRELAVAAPLALGLGLACFFRVLLTAHASAAAVKTALAITVAMAATVLAAVAVGAGAPLLLARNGVDPVTCASPVLATFVDLIGVVILCGIGNALLPRPIARAIAPV